MDEKSMKGKKNGYDCPDCGALLVTVHADDGCAPMFKACLKCGGMAASRMYDGSVDTLEPQGEWYRPTNLTGLDEQTRQYVEGGSLLFRPVARSKEGKR